MEGCSSVPDQSTRLLEGAICEAARSTGNYAITATVALVVVSAPSPSHTKAQVPRERPTSSAYQDPPNLCCSPTPPLSAGCTNVATALPPSGGREGSYLSLSLSLCTECGNLGLSAVGQCLLKA